MPQIRSVTALTAFLVLAGPLHAATLTYTYTCDFDGNTTGGDFLPSFDTSLGTLTSVSLTNVVDLNLSMSVKNTGAPSDFEVYAGVLSNFVIEDANFVGYLATDSYDSADTTVHLETGESFTQTFAGPTTPSYYGFHFVSIPNGLLTSADDLARFSSGASLPIVNQAIPDLGVIPSDPSATFPQDSSGSTLLATYTVTYTYQAVPEPASMTALGLGALALLRRRRR